MTLYLRALGRVVWRVMWPVLLRFAAAVLSGTVTFGPFSVAVWHDNGLLAIAGALWAMLTGYAGFWWSNHGRHLVTAEAEIIATERLDLTEQGGELALAELQQAADDAAVYDLTDEQRRSLGYPAKAKAKAKVSETYGVRSYP